MEHWNTNRANRRPLPPPPAAQNPYEHPLARTLRQANEHLPGNPAIDTTTIVLEPVTHTPPYRVPETPQVQRALRARLDKEKIKKGISFLNKTACVTGVVGTCGAGATAVSAVGNLTVPLIISPIITACCLTLCVTSIIRANQLKKQ